jgi:hypothetical protein
MFIVGILGWWYGQGWRQRAVRLGERLASTADYFSIDLLARTLFSPYRQISAGKVRGPLGVQLRAFFDRLVSRLIGAMIRLTMIVVGAVALVLYAFVGVALLAAWAVVPLGPVLGIVLFVVGWTPWSL